MINPQVFQDMKSKNEYFVYVGKKRSILGFLIILLLLFGNLITIAQTTGLGWVDNEIIPLNSFTNKDNWTCNFHRYIGDNCCAKTGDTCYATI